MFPLKKLKYEHPEKISNEYHNKLCDKVPERINKNLKENRNKKLI